MLKPNVNCVTLAAGCSTPQVYNVNWVVKMYPLRGGDMSLPAPKVAPPLVVKYVIVVQQFEIELETC